MENNQAELAPDNAIEKLTEFVEANRVSVELPPKQMFDVNKFQANVAMLAQDKESEHEKRAQQQRVQSRRRQFHSLVAAAGERYRTCTLNNFKGDYRQLLAVVQEVKEYVKGGCTCGLTLYGPVGTGKDHLAFAVCVEAIRLGKAVRWINGQRWFGSIRDAMDTNRSEADIILELAMPDVLCISDPLPPIGQLTQHQATMLYRLVDARYGRSLPTIVTVNVANDAEADERMGVATWDRLTHDAWKLFCNWPSYRKPKREIK